MARLTMTLSSTFTNLFEISDLIRTKSMNIWRMKF